MLWFPQSNKIREYKRIRELGRELTSEMIGVIPKQSLDRVARDMNIIHKGVFVFDSEEEMSFLQDRLIYDILWEGKNAVEHFEIERGADLSEDEKEILKGMKEAYFSLFEVVGTKRGESLQLLDLLSGSRIEIMDINLSSTAPKGSLLATRVVKIQDICMNSGVIYPFLPSQKDILISGLKATQTAPRSRKKKPCPTYYKLQRPQKLQPLFLQAI